MVVIATNNNPCSLVSPSAYDTAWLAMIPNSQKKSGKPMFKGCLDWVLNNQMPLGFWGESDFHGNPTIDSLPSTLACMVALKKWDIGHEHIQKGMVFINATSTKLLKQKSNNMNYPRRFAIVFPEMLQLARRTGLHIKFPDEIKEVVASLFCQRHQILQTEELVNKYHYPPLLSYLEALPPTYQIHSASILENLGEDGSLFESPSATAAAFMATRNQQSLSYLHRLVQNCTSGGVPSKYPINENFIKLNMVHQLQRLGLSEYFSDEIKDISKDIYRQYSEQEPSQHCLIPQNLLMDSLAFQLLRMQGYEVSPRRLCWFLNDENALKYIEENYENFSSMLCSLYRATNLMFEGEVELQELRSFTRRLLEKSSLICRTLDDDTIMWPHLQEEIKHELRVPWIARMEHLDHRKWIEANKEIRPLWLGKASFFRISCMENNDLFQLAIQSYEYRQTVYKAELEDLIRWSKACGLMDMGFAREKTTYCYFAIASSTTLPYDSYVRLIVAKAAVLITVIDDFFDMEGSLAELQILTKAVQRWNGKGLEGHSRILFDALDKFVTETADKYLDQYKIDIIDNLRQIWYETFASWLMEATWSKTGQVPSMASYLGTGMISIAIHTIVLQASCFLTPSFSPHKLNPSQYEAITKFLMISCRLLNDMQSYKKEEKDGKTNSVLLYLRENPNANMEDALQYVQTIIDEAKMKLLEHVLMDGFDDLPRPCRMLHLSCLKVFQMFFNSANHFDSKDSLISDINKAIFSPLEHPINFQPPNSLGHHSPLKKKVLMSNSQYNISLKYHRRRSQFKMNLIHFAMPPGSYQARMVITPKPKLSVL